MNEEKIKKMLDRNDKAGPVLAIFCKFDDTFKDYIDVLEQRLINLEVKGKGPFTRNLTARELERISSGLEYHGLHSGLNELKFIHSKLQESLMDALKAGGVSLSEIND